MPPKGFNYNKSKNIMKCLKCYCREKTENDIYCKWHRQELKNGDDI